MTGQVVGASAVNNRRAEFVQISAALGIFFLGVLVYLFDRSGSDIYFIPDWWRFADGTPALFGVLGYSLPSFAHTYPFIQRAADAMAVRAADDLHRLVCR